jgi:hypothetical protein
LVVIGFLYSVYDYLNTMAALNPIIPIPVVNNWRVCLEGIIGCNATTVDYLFDDRVGVDTVDAFVQIPASSFDGWIKASSDLKRIRPFADGTCTTRRDIDVVEMLQSVEGFVLLP